MTDWFRAAVVDPERPHKDAAVEFIRAGGVLSWQEWATLTPQSRDDFVNAGVQVGIENAQFAVSSMVRMLTELGVEAQLAEAVDKAAERLTT